MGDEAKPITPDVNICAAISAHCCWTIWLHFCSISMNAGHGGGKTCFSSPLPLNMAEGSWRGANGNTGITERDSRMVGIRRYRDNGDRRSDKGAYGDTKVTEMDSATGSIYLRHPAVDRNHFNLLSYNKIHTFSVPAFGLTCYFRAFLDRCNCVVSHCWVVFYLLTLLVPSLSRNNSFSRSRLGFHKRCGRVFMMGSVPSSSVISPKMEPTCWFWFGTLSTEWWERPPQANASKMETSN